MATVANNTKKKAGNCRLVGTAKVFDFYMSGHIRNDFADLPSPSTRVLYYELEVDVVDGGPAAPTASGRFAGVKGKLQAAPFLLLADAPSQNLRRWTSVGLWEVTAQQLDAFDSGLLRLDLLSQGTTATGAVGRRSAVDDSARITPGWERVWCCSFLCDCDYTCPNRLVGAPSERPPHEIFFRPDIKGFGVRGTARVLARTVVMVYVGRLRTQPRGENEDETYFFELPIINGSGGMQGTKYLCDASRISSPARYLNHSCVPNMAQVMLDSVHLDLRLPTTAFMALRDIEPGEEWTFDYRAGEKFQGSFKVGECMCGSELCRLKDDDEVPEVVSIPRKRRK